MNCYGSLSLTETSPPQSFTEVLSIASVKKFLNLPARSPVDSAEDDELTAMIAAAREIAEGQQNRDLVRKQYDLSLDYWTDYEIGLRDPLVSVDLVKYRDSNGAYTTMAVNTDYIVDTAKHPGVILPPFNSTWPWFTPWPSSPILIRFTSGFTSTAAFWSDSGVRVKQGMLLLISEWYNNRLPVSYDIAAGSGKPITDRIMSLLSTGALTRSC